LKQIKYGEWEFSTLFSIARIVILIDFLRVPAIINVTEIANLVKARDAKLWVYRRIHPDHDCQAAEVGYKNFLLIGFYPAGLTYSDPLVFNTKCAVIREFFWKES
jgi:hypothetical protein